MLKLFKAKYKIIPDPFLLDTPLGRIISEIEFNGLKLSGFRPDSIGEISDEAFLYGWNFPDVHMELLRTAIIPQIPNHMQTEKCIGFVWRVKNLSQKMDISIHYKLVPQGKADWDAESGERILAQSWENNDYRLSIGTQDEEALKGMSCRNYLPSRFTEQKLLDSEILENYAKGLGISLPTFLENEEGQVHFIVAWANKKKTDSIAAWYAVDQKPEYILQSSGLV